MSHTQRQLNILRYIPLILLGVLLEVLFLCVHVLLDVAGYREFSNSHLLTFEILIMYFVYPMGAAMMYALVIKKTRLIPCALLGAYVLTNMFSVALLLFRGHYAVELITAFSTGLMISVSFKIAIQCLLFIVSFSLIKKLYDMYKINTGKGF